MLDISEVLRLPQNLGEWRSRDQTYSCESSPRELDGQWFQFTYQPHPTREGDSKFIRSGCLGTVSVMKSQCCLNPHFLWSLLDGFPEELFPSGRKLTMFTLVWPQAKYISYLKNKRHTHIHHYFMSFPFFLALILLFNSLIVQLFFFFFLSFFLLATYWLLHYFSCMLLSYSISLVSSFYFFMSSNLRVSNLL